MKIAWIMPQMTAAMSTPAQYLTAKTTRRD